MKTERLHYDDPLRLELTSTVVAHDTWKGTESVILDRTVFYPESGGQMGDRGVLEQADVTDVQIDEDGRVHHLVRGPRPPIGATVTGRVDATRRRLHMALHTGQHALSRALLDHLGAVTISSRLGASACTLDVDVAGLTLERLRPVQDAVNALIDEDRPVRQVFPDDLELARLSLRKPPPAADRVRIVDIDGFDVTPCGGTHVTRTSQIELLVIESVERYKGGSRISFEAGPRARETLLTESERLRSLASELRCAPPELGAIIAGLTEKLEIARDEAGSLRARLAEVWAARLTAERAASAPPSDDVVAVVAGADPALLRSIAERLASERALIALAAPDDAGTQVLIARGGARGISANALLNEIARASGGRGGGRPELAQGRLPALPSATDWAVLVRDAITRLTS